MAISNFANIFSKYLLLTLYFNACNASFQFTLKTLLEKSLPEDAMLNFTQLAKKYGHSAQEHEVKTEDGYVLTVFRIPGKKPPVLLFHGLADTADTFIISGHTSMAITLAGAGYEVWAGNNRGNKYARRHVRLNPDTDKQFWKYSFHEIGYYDLAATIDFIRKKTGEDSIPVVGHSQGSVIQYVLVSLRPEYNSRIKVSIGLAPGVFFDNSVYPLKFFTSVGPVIDSLIPSQFQEFLPDYKMMSNILKLICSRGDASFRFCVNSLMFLFAGPTHTDHMDPEFLKVVMGHIPSALSRKNVMHYDQLFVRKRFSQYDYGLSENMAKYGKAEPPDYDLGAVSMPTALLTGKSDRIVRMKDVEHLRDCLPNVVYYEVMKPKLWNHFDFVWGSQMPTHLYPSIFGLLKKFC